MVDTSGESENRSRAAPERGGAPTRNSDAYLKLLALTLVITLSSTPLVAGQSQSQEREREREASWQQRSRSYRSVPPREHLVREP